MSIFKICIYPPLNFNNLIKRLFLENLPLLTDLVLEYSILLAYSVPSEFAFSETGYLKNKHRTSMHPTKFNSLICDQTLRIKK